MKKVLSVLFVLAIFVGSYGNTASASYDEVPRVFSLPKPITLLM